MPSGEAEEGSPTQGPLRSRDSLTLSEGPHAKRRNSLPCRGAPAGAHFWCRPRQTGATRVAPYTMVDLERRTPCPAGGSTRATLRIGRELRPRFFESVEQPRHVTEFNGAGPWGERT